MNQFETAVWEVNHAGQAREGNEDDELIMLGSSGPSINAVCPLSGKQVPFALSLGGASITLLWPSAHWPLSPCGVWKAAFPSCV